MERIAIFGASGFVGTALAERLRRNDRIEILPFIHSTGGAARLARLGLELRRMDILDRAKVRDAIRGCTHVVNCVYSSNDVLLRGLENLLEACSAEHVDRYVHLSSVAVYGDPPPPDSMTEDAKPRPEHGGYGWAKLRQDEMIAEACKNGLSSVILCPPMVTGAYSRHLLAFLAAISAGSFALVEGGDLPCNFVDVQNLTHAIELALWCKRGDAKRMFITDNQRTTWRQVVEALAPMAEEQSFPTSISREEALQIISGAAKPRKSLVRAVRHLLSPDVRRILSRDPLLAALEGKAARATPQFLRSSLRSSFGARTPASVVSNIAQAPVSYDAELLRLQLRNVLHSCKRAERELGYSPELAFDQSMQRFRHWYAALYGWGSPSWDLLRLLQGNSIAPL